MLNYSSAIKLITVIYPRQAQESFRNEVHISRLVIISTTNGYEEEENLKRMVVGHCHV